jgi:putative redox-active protein with C_GCAxxG_C_C motif
MAGHNPQGPAVAAEPSAATRRAYRRRGLINLSTMGHCAPSVLQALLDVSKTRNAWAVRATAGLPGGIGNTGNECGGLTAPLVMLGARYGLGTASDGLPQVLDKGHDLCRRFLRCNGTLLCREIRGHARVPLRCVQVVRRSPELYGETIAGDRPAAIQGEQREAYRQLYAHLCANDFHCAHAVLQELRETVPVDQDLLDGTSAFMGGTLFQGMTCSTLTAGIMAVGLKLGRIEHSRLRVIRMIATMAAGGDAFADGMNEFNRIMNAGKRIAQWFAGEFGSTQCRDITSSDFSSAAGVKRFIDSDGAARCKTIARAVAGRVRLVMAEPRPRQ